MEHAITVDKVGGRWVAKSAERIAAVHKGLRMLAGRCDGAREPGTGERMTNVQDCA